MPPPGVRLMTVRDVARRVMLSESSIRRKMASGELASTRLGSSLRTWEGAVDRWVEDNIVDPPDSGRSASPEAYGSDTTLSLRDLVRRQEKAEA